MKSQQWSFRVIRRMAIGVGTFLFGWGWTGVAPISLPFELPAITLPSFDWMGASSSAAISAGPVPGIPEPASWALMIGGMLILGMALRTHPRRLRVAY